MTNTERTCSIQAVSPKPCTFSSRQAQNSVNLRTAGRQGKQGDPSCLELEHGLGGEGSLSWQQACPVHPLPPPTLARHFSISILQPPAQ